MKNLKLALILCLVTLFFNIIYYYYILPKIIEDRAKDLGIMQYNGKKDRFVAKDSITLYQDDIYYLQYGNTNGY